jgi:hypothetical protein
MSRVGFQTTIPAFERAKTVHALDRAATVICNVKKKKLRCLVPRDRRLSAKLMPTLADRRCRVVRATNPHGR